MAQMSDAVRQDIEQRLQRFLTANKGYENPTFVNSGGSAAIYRVDTPNGVRAIKVYDPSFLQGDKAKAEERRLDLQRSLVGHGCPTLVEIFRVEQSEETAFLEMEFIEWPQLKTVLANIPDDAISGLIGQLVSATQYLEKLEIVHRDIKPENIHISPNFESLKLIDLGVARELVHAEEESPAATDSGSKRPFISTAQYSSPEYLFRLDAPSADLWKGLNLYQVGAVLHDMINKRPIFQNEVDLENRWLIARAVLEQVPTFPDADPTRLAAQKTLAARCLVKDLKTRLAIVDWADFSFDASSNPLDALMAKLAKGHGAASAVSAEGRRNFERAAFAKRCCESIRVELIGACGNKVPFALIATNSPFRYLFEFDASTEHKILVDIGFVWFGEMQEKSAQVVLRSAVRFEQEALSQKSEHLVTVGTIGEAEDVTVHDTACRIAECISKGLDLIDSGADKAAVHDTDIGLLTLAKKD